MRTPSPDDLAAQGFKVYPGAVLPPREGPAPSIVPDFTPINVDELEEFEVVENHMLSPFWRTHPSDQTWGARPPTHAELRAARIRPTERVVLIRPRKGHTGRAARRPCNARTRGSRRSSGIRSGQDPGEGELDPPDELVPALLGRSG